MFHIFRNGNFGAVRRVVTRRVTRRIIDCIDVSIAFARTFGAKLETGIGSTGICILYVARRVAVALVIIRLITGYGIKHIRRIRISHVRNSDGRGDVTHPAVRRPKFIRRKHCINNRRCGIGHAIIDGIGIIQHAVRHL